MRQKILFNKMTPKKINLTLKKTNLTLKDILQRESYLKKKNLKRGLSIK